MKNGDGSILAEVGGRSVYQGRKTAYSDFNRVTESLRQPGSAMKPIVYLAAFLRGGFTLDTLVPDEPISVPMGRDSPRKWIANYDGLFKGPIPMREALAESRNAVAIWLTGQVGIDRVLRTGPQPRRRDPPAALRHDRVGCIRGQLAGTGDGLPHDCLRIVARPHVIRQIVRGSGDVIPGPGHTPVPLALGAGALALIQEGLRGVVRYPDGHGARP
jgi:hypothetical protein